MEDIKHTKANKKIGKKLLIIILLFAISLGGGVIGAFLIHKMIPSSTITQTTTLGTDNTASKSSSIVAKKMTKSVVAITTETMETSNFWFGTQVSSGAGSGVILTKDGYIITCAHVVNGASTIKVTTSDNHTYSAKLVGSYTAGDIAVLKINATDLTPTTIADSSKVVQGEITYAVGNPEGTFSNSITSGIVSALNRTITVAIEDDDSQSNNFSRFGQFSQTQAAKLNVIQTDAAVSPGNSGGGLFNANGDLIGIVNAKSSASNSEGLGFAIYGNKALEIAKSIMKTGKYTA